MLEIIQEDNGKLSFSRSLSAIIVLSVLVMVMFVTFKDGKLPDYGGATLFLTGSVASLYGSNKIASAISGENKP